MENKLTSITHRETFRAWLIQHTEIEKECWVAISMKPSLDTLLYLDAVEEALCFGWIDSTKKKVDHKTFQRFSPRRKKSSWTQLNIQRVLRLQKLGFMTSQGLAALPNDVHTFNIDPDIIAELKKDSIAYDNFCKMHPIYQRIRIDTIQSVKGNPEHYHRRLTRFIENTRNNIMYGQWHDNGRLIDNTITCGNDNK